MAKGSSNQAPQVSAVQPSMSSTMRLSICPLFSQPVTVPFGGKPTGFRRGSMSRAATLQQVQQVSGTPDPATAVTFKLRKMRDVR